MITNKSEKFLNQSSLRSDIRFWTLGGNLFLSLGAYAPKADPSVPDLSSSSTRASRASRSGTGPFFCSYCVLYSLVRALKSIRSARIKSLSSPSSKKSMQASQNSSPGLSSLYSVISYKIQVSAMISTGSNFSRISFSSSFYAGVKLASYLA